MFAPSDVAFIEDPYDAHEELRRDAPILYDEATDHWLVSRYADVNALLRDRRLGRTYLHVANHEEMGHEPPPDWHAPFWHLINAGILDMEPPDHTRVRQLVSKAFTPAYVEGLRPRVEAIVDDLVGPLTGALARERRTRLGDDLISQLVHVVDEGDRLSEDELVGTCALLLNAGHEATVNSTLLGWWTLFRHPDRLAELRADPALIPSAVEELLRFQTPLPLFERWVAEPIELHGVDVPRGAELGLLFDSANPDPEVFEAPAELRLDRSPNPHLAFGAGIHFCLGAPLEHLELQTSFRALLTRFPAMEPVETPRFKPNYVIRGLDGLRVRL